MIRVEIDGIEDLERDFRRIEQAISDAAREAVREGSQAGVDYAKANHRYKDQTGLLTGTAFAKVEVSAPGGAYGQMTWPRPYASFVEDGTRPHPIFGNPFLHFRWKGVWVTFRSVNHPGTKPYGFAGDAYLVCERVMIRALEVGVSNASKILD